MKNKYAASNARARSKSFLLSFDEIRKIKEDFAKEKRSCSYDLSSHEKKELNFKVINAEINKRNKCVDKTIILSKEYHKINLMASPKKNKYFKARLKHPLLPTSRVDDEDYKIALIEFIKKEHQMKINLKKVMKNKEKTKSTAETTEFGSKRINPSKLKNKKEKEKEVILEEETQIVEPLFRRKKLIN